MKRVIKNFFFCLTTAFIFTASVASATPVCQVLDKSASKLDISLDLFGEIKKSKVEKVKAFLWIDPEHPEGANLEALLEPHISQLFGNFEDNPLMIGMLANFLDKDLVFKSSSVVKKADSDRYKVNGQVTSGNKKYPADFNVSLDKIRQNKSQFTAKVESDNFQKIIGVPGSAKGDFDLVFIAKPEISKANCRISNPDK